MLDVRDKMIQLLIGACIDSDGRALPFPSQSAKYIVPMLPGGVSPADLQVTANGPPDKPIFLDTVRFRLRKEQLVYNSAVFEQLFVSHRSVDYRQGERMRREQKERGGHMEICFYRGRFLQSRKIASRQRPRENQVCSTGPCCPEE